MMLRSALIFIHSIFAVFPESRSTPRKETPKSKVRFSILKCKETFVRLEGIFFKLDESVKCLCVGPTGRTSFNVNVKAEVGHRVEGEWASTLRLPAGPAEKGEGLEPGPAFSRPPSSPRTSSPAIHRQRAQLPQRPRQPPTRRKFKVSFNFDLEICFHGRHENRPNEENLTSYIRSNLTTISRAMCSMHTPAAGWQDHSKPLYVLDIEALSQELLLLLWHYNINKTVSLGCCMKGTLGKIKKKIRLDFQQLFASIHACGPTSSRSGGLLNKILKFEGFELNRASKELQRRKAGHRCGCM